MDKLSVKQSLHRATLKGVAFFWLVTVFITVFKDTYMQDIPFEVTSPFIFMQFPGAIPIVFWNILFASAGVHADGNFFVMGVFNMIFYYYLVYWVIRVYRKVKSKRMSKYN